MTFRPSYQQQETFVTEPRGDMTVDTLTQEQLNKRMSEEGLRRARKELGKAAERGALGASPAAMTLVKHYIDPLSEVIANYFFECANGVGRQPAFYNLCGHMDTRTLAYIAISSSFSLFDLSADKVYITRAAREIGRAVELELMLTEFRKQFPRKFPHILAAIQRRGLGKDRAYDQWKTNAREHSLKFDHWDSDGIIRVGMVLIDMIIETLPLIEVMLDTSPEASKRRRKNWAAPRYVVLTDETQRWLLERTELIGQFRPVHLPAVVPPVDWEAQTGGGYPTEKLSKARLVREPPHKCGLRNGPSQDRSTLGPVLKSVNAMQATPFQINQKVLGVVKEAWERNLVIGNLPMREDREIPPRPWDYGQNAEATEEWKAKARYAHTLNKTTLNHRVSTQHLIDLHSEFSGAPELYFPQVLDFRSRSYPLSHIINPQGSDLQKGLLMFSEPGEQSQYAYAWSAIHGANSYGIDKVPFHERLGWVRQHSARIMATAADPWADLWWTEADSPWSFLAWCFEYASDGPLFLPVSLDGSCNGIQHLSAILRDPVGAEAVNLLPSDTPQDLYGRVAQATMVRLRASADEGDWVAAAWLAFGLNRKMVKRQVMVLPYGGTTYSCLDYTRDAVKERLKDGEENPFGEELEAAISVLSRHIWVSIGDVVVAAKDVMVWLREVARITARENKPLIWTTPAGFTVHQSYQCLKRRQVKCHTLGNAVWLEERVRLDKIDPIRQANSFPPNFIHSYDASALHLTVGRAKDAGINSFMMIHDSYGAHPHNIGKLRDITRNTFADMYGASDNHLEDLRQEIQRRTGMELPPPPMTLGLDINLVRESEYFFA